MDEREIDRICQELYSEWIEPGGYLFEFRHGVYDHEAFGRLCETIDSVEFADDKIEKRIVALIWRIPFFMERHLHRVADRGGNDRLARDSLGILYELINSKLSDWSWLERDEPRF
jgi:hypothetical protein